MKNDFAFCFVCHSGISMHAPPVITFFFLSLIHLFLIKVCVFIRQLVKSDEGNFIRNLIW